MSTKTTTMVPAAKKRSAVLRKMTEPLQAVAIEIERRLGGAALGNVIVSHDIGMLIIEVLSKETEYGSDALEQLAAYLGGELQRGNSKTSLSNLRDFADAFPKEYVKAWTEKPMAAGGRLTVAHWMALRMVAEREQQEKWLNKVINNTSSMSAAQLNDEIAAQGTKKKNVRSSGRHHGKPTSSIGGILRFGNLTQSLLNYEVQVAEGIFDAIDEMAPDSVNKILLDRLTATEDTVVKTVTKLGEAGKRLGGNISRVKEILQSQADEAVAAREAAGEDENQEEPDEKTKKKTKKTKKKPVSVSNGEVKKKKKKSLRPEAATVGG